jgi:hypothetical protein
MESQWSGKESFIRRKLSCWIILFVMHQELNRRQKGNDYFPVRNHVQEIRKIQSHTHGSQNLWDCQGGNPERRCSNQIEPSNVWQLGSNECTENNIECIQLND